MEMCQLANRQWRSQNTVNVQHQREDSWSSSDSLQLRPFSKMGTSLKGKNLLPEGANSSGSKFFPLRAVPYGMINHFYHIE